MSLSRTHRHIRLAHLTNPTKLTSSPHFQRQIAPLSPFFTKYSTLSNVTSYSNIPQSISAKLGLNLHQRPNHPLYLLKHKIFQYFNSLRNTHFHLVDDLPAQVRTLHNFDDLLIPTDHVSRSKSDTYYVNEQEVLRTHMTAHTPVLLGEGHKAFLACGDVYRRDEVDATHYPVFHQIDGVRVIDRAEYEAFLESQEYADLQNEWNKETERDPEDAAIREIKTFEEYVVYDLQKTLSGMAKHLFGESAQLMWRTDSFPFTHPSYELNVHHNDKELELLGSGILKGQIMHNCGFEDNGEKHLAWAFGIGLERIAMKFFEVPDIRLFWSEDPRFLQQFEANGIDTRFETYSKFPPCYKDISFWVPENFHDNDFYETVREIGGDLVESVEVVDQFYHPKKKQTSMCYRINYRSMDRNLTNAEINELQERLIDQTVEKLGCTLRDGSKV